MGSWQYVYCIVEGAGLPLGAYDGLEGGLVRTIVYREISAVVSEVQVRHVPATPGHVLAHERLVEALMDRVAVLPVRFGTVLSGARTVKLELSGDYASHVGDLQRVRGRVEMGIRVLAPPDMPESEAGIPDPLPPAGPGTRYLMERLRATGRCRATRRHYERWARMIDGRLMRRAEEGRLSAAPSEKMVMSAAYLVSRHRLDGFKEEVEALRRDLPELRFLFTGPWPAYSFVGGLAGRARLLPAIG